MNDRPDRAARQILAPLIPGRAFLRRDRDAALFITNAPRIAPDPAFENAVREAGFITAEENGLMRISPGPAWLLNLEAEYPAPPDHLSGTLLRFKGEAPVPEAMALFALGLRILDGDPPDNYEDRLRRCAAVCLRKHAGGGLYACAVVNHLIRKERMQ